MIVVKKITPTIGAVIEGVNFSEPIEKITKKGFSVDHSTDK